jgi:ubiquinone/menaquinone biosynthesis C-methylase UbiE
MIPVVVNWVFILVLVPLILYQVRKPSRWIGRPMLLSMNKSHSSMTDWGLRQLRIERGFAILDVGCGGGRTIEKLWAMTDGPVCGIDYSAESVALARKVNAAAIGAGHVDIRQAPVSAIPFPDGRFDLATAIETHYYWPDIVAGMKEIRRVLKPGGTAMLLAESYKGAPLHQFQWAVMTALRAVHLSVDEHRQAFEAAGFTDVKIVIADNKRWICVLGQNPNA